MGTFRGALSAAVALLVCLLHGKIIPQQHTGLQSYSVIFFISTFVSSICRLQYFVRTTNQWIRSSAWQQAGLKSTKYFNYVMAASIQCMLYLQVTGRLLCGALPASGVRVKLIDDDFGQLVKEREGESVDEWPTSTRL